MSLQIDQFLMVLAIAAFAAVLAGQTSAMALSFASRQDEKADKSAKGKKAPLATWLALGGGRRKVWTHVGDLVLKDGRGREFSQFSVRARIHEGRFVKVEALDMKSGRTREFMAIATSGKVEFTLAELAPAYADCAAASAKIKLSLFWPNSLRNKRFGFDSRAYEIAIIEAKLERISRKADRLRERVLEEEARKRAKAEQGARRGPMDAAKADVIKILRELPAGDLRDRAAKVAAAAWNAGPKTAPQARIDAAKVLHPDKVCDPATATITSRILAMLNAKLDKTMKDAVA